MSFKPRLINVTFTLGEGAFGASGNNTVKLSGLRVSCKIVKAGGAAMSTLQMQVYGMPLNMMNQLSTLGMAVRLVRINLVTVEAGDADGMSTVFAGTIKNAWTDLQSAPDVPFRVEAQAGLIEAVKTIPPSSYPGPTSVDTIMSKLASQAGLKYENNGVKTVLDKPHYYGSLRDQMAKCVEAASCEWIIDDGTLAIWPVGSARDTSTVPLVSKTTGMEKYPSYTSQGVSIKTLFNPAVKFGQRIEVKSELGDPASGNWDIYMLDHDLESKVLKGQWFTTIGAARPGLGPMVP